MKQYFSYFVFLGISCLIGISTLQAEDNDVLGSQWTKTLSEAYQQNQFSDFLNKMEIRYKEGLKNKDWDDLHYEQKKLQKDFATSEGKQRFKELSKNSHNYMHELNLLRKERNKSLLLIANKYPNFFISKIIHDLKPYSYETANEVNEKGASFQFNEIHFKTHVFLSLLSMATLTENDEANWTGLGKISSEESEKYYYVTGLNEFQEMLKQVDQENVKEEIIDQMSTYSIMFSNNHNEKILQSLGKEIRQPENAAEKCVVEIMKKFQQEQINLIQKHHLKS